MYCMIHKCTQYSKNDSINYVAEHVYSATSLCRYLDNNNLSIAIL